MTNAVSALARAQSELGHRVVIAAAKEENTPLYGPVRVAPSVTLLLWEPSQTMRFGRRKVRFIGKSAACAMREANPDVVHVHGELNADNLSTPRVFTAPIVLSPHGGFHPTVLSKGQQLIKRGYLALARRVLYERVAALHAMCPAEKLHILNLLPGSRVYCVPHGSRPNIHPEQRPVLNPSDSVNLLFIGRLDVYTKGLDILLDAFSLVLKSVRRKTFLHLVGPDWQNGEQRLRQQAARLGIHERVIFHRACRPDEAVSFMRNADVYVQLSRHDGFPLSVADALVACKPAILSQAVGTTSFEEIYSLPHVRIVPPNAREAAIGIVGILGSLADVTVMAGLHEATLRSFFSWSRAAAAHTEQYLALAPMNGDAQRPALCA